MSRIVDNLVAYKILMMLCTPFEETQAFKLGIIDDEGKTLKKFNTLKTSEERDAFTYLNRLVFNMKKIINRLPGGESRLKNIVAALFLVKEQYVSRDRTTSLMESRYKAILEQVDAGVILVEEEIQLKKFLHLYEDGVVGGAPVNNTAGAAVNDPKIEKKDIKKYQKLARRKAPLNVGT